MNPNDPQVIIWTMWDGLTEMAPSHMEYSVMDHNGYNGGHNTVFIPRSETHLLGIKMGWWPAGPSDYVIYNPNTLEFMAAQAIYFADETPN